MLDPHETLHEELRDRYELEDVLGEGGMGTVYVARDRKHDRRVAIKTIRPDLTTDAVRKRFEREIAITAGLQHPHILPLLDSGVAGETLYYVMPYVEGDSLRARLRRDGKLPIEEVVRIGREVASALASAHEKGVVHRDIKPENILLAGGHAMIVDFGVAKALAETDREALTQTGGVLGSPNYMAPEQAVGVVTPSSDIYSLGLVLYEAATGQRWEGDTKADWTDVPAGLRSVIERALQWIPKDRWPDAAEFRRGLKASAGAKRQPVRLATIGAAAAVLLAAAGWWAATNFGGMPATASDDGRRGSIAVLPLENLSGDEETEYFSDGITEDIIAQLSKIRDLKVISRTSIMQYKQTDKTLREIGEELHVATVLEGSVRRAGDRVRIVSQLIDASTDDHIWAETYDRELTDVFTIQSEVAQQIAEALKATISPQERILIQRRPTDDIEAHTLYLRGRYLWNRRTRAGLESAVEYFEQAIARDSSYAPAYAGLADAYLLLGSYQYLPELEAISRAKAAVERALELDDRLAEAYAPLGQILRSERDWVGEERAYLRAIELNPNYATAHQWYATLLAALGRPEEAIREIRWAQELDPLSHGISVTAGVVLFLARDFEGAIEQLNETLELAPEYFSAYAWLTMAYTELGRYEDALRSWESLTELRPGLPGGRVLVARAHARAGETERAHEVLRQMEADGEDPHLRAAVYAALGERDRALALLEQAVTDDSWSLFVLFRTWLFYMNVAPWYDPLRADPRFDALLAQMNFG